MIQCDQVLRDMPLLASVFLLGWTLFGQQGNAADLGYPPPPGAYRSEATTLADPSQAPYPEDRSDPGIKAEPSAPGSSRLLPLPDDAFASEPPGRYDAANLFGAKPPAQSPPPQPAGQAHLSPRSTPSLQQFAPPALTVETGPGRHDFSVDTGWSNQQQAPAPAYYGQDNPDYQGYPSYAPAYPAYQQHANPYYPESSSDYPPAASEPSYRGQIDYYAPQHPQAAVGIPSGGHYPAYAPAEGGYAPEAAYYAPTYPQDYYPTDSYPPVPAAVIGPGHDPASFRSRDDAGKAAQAATSLPQGGHSSVFRPAN